MWWQLSQTPPVVWASTCLRLVLRSAVAGGSAVASAPGGGVPIDTTADVALDGAIQHVTNAYDFMQKLAASPMAQHRYAERLTSYLYERDGEPMDCGTVNDLAAKIAPGGYTVLNLITDLTQTPQFRTRAVGAM